MKNLKKLVISLLAVVLTLTVVSAQSTEAKSANRIELACKDKVTVYQGETISISVNVVYKNGKKMSGDQKSIWKKLKANSSNKSVATVSKDGKVTAKKAGKATISISLASNKKVKTSISLTVKNTSGKPSITLSKKSVELSTGESTTIKVKSVKGVSSKSVTFASKNKSVATVSEDGRVEAKGEGTTTITVTSVTNSKVKATFKVTVEDVYDCEKSGHVWGEWKYCPEPTCTKDGYQYRVCKECNESEWQDLPALGHNWVVKEHVCAAKGVTGGDKCICSRCKAKELRNVVYYQPTEEELAAVLASLKQEYPTGTEWGGTKEASEYNGVSFFKHYEEGDENAYLNECNQYLSGCAGFTSRVSDAIFGSNVLYRTHHDPIRVRIGDVIYFEGDNINHEVIVIGFTADGGWITAEGNVGGKVEWSMNVRKMVGTDLYTACGETQDGEVVDSKYYGLRSHNTKISVYTRWK